MKIVHPVEKPVRHFYFPVTIYTLSKMRNRLYLAVLFLMVMGFIFTPSSLAKADPQELPYRYLYIAAMIITVLLPILFPLILSNGNLLITADSIVFTQGGLKPFQITVPKKEIRYFSLEIPSPYPRRIYVNIRSILILEDGREIEFDIVSSSIKNKQGIELLDILEAAIKSEGLDTFSVS